MLYSLFPKVVEIQALMKYYDVNKDGTISLGEFIHGLREPLNDRRLNIVKKAFAALKKNDDGKIPISEIIATYDVHAHPRFINGSCTRDQLLNEFLLYFVSTKNWYIVEKEFFKYYQDLSMTYTNDEEFINLVENSWSLSEDEGASVF